MSNSNKDLAIEALYNELNATRLKVLKLQKQLGDEVEKDIIVDEIEQICLNEVRKLKILSENAVLTLADAKLLDIVHKNLRQIRGVSEDGNEDIGDTKYTTSELISIVKSK